MIRTNKILAFNSGGTTLKSTVLITTQIRFDDESKTSIIGQCDQCFVDGVQMVFLHQYQELDTEETADWCK